MPSGRTSSHELLRLLAEVDEPEETPSDADTGREEAQFRQVTEEELLRALTTEAQRRAEPQPEEPADYEE